MGRWGRLFCGFFGGGGGGGGSVDKGVLEVGGWFLQGGLGLVLSGCGNAATAAGGVWGDSVAAARYRAFGVLLAGF